MAAVDNQMDALRHAMRMYPNARHVALLPGDAVPTKGASAISSSLPEGVSITGAESYAKYEAEFQGWFTGPQWMLLAACDVRKVLRHWTPLMRVNINKWHELYWVDEHRHAGDTPESQTIATVLHGLLKVPIAFPGECILQETLHTLGHPMCGCVLPGVEILEHYDGVELISCLEGAICDPLTLAFRGVDTGMSYSRLEKILTEKGVL